MYFINTKYILLWATPKTPKNNPRITKWDRVAQTQFLWETLKMSLEYLILTQYCLDKAYFLQASQLQVRQ